MKWTKERKEARKILAKERGYGKWMQGKKLTKEHKENIGKASRGKPFSGIKCDWNGRKHNENSKIKMANAHFKDEKMLCVASIHDRIIKKYGQPKHCEHCNSITKKLYDWSNKDHKYSLKRIDWQRLCRGCHIKYDKKLKELDSERNAC